MTINRFRLLLFSYCLLLIALCLYSFTQIDLNLTLSSNSFLFSFQKIFQNIGYFQRPLSTGIFLSILFVFFLFYFLFIILTAKKKLTLKQIITLITATTILLVLSYPAFSHDIFNYIFYGRIVTHYRLSPYNFRALDFPNDSWTRFMHWTHNTYPYGPFWLVLTIPLSFLGLQKFIPTLILYKFLMAGGYLLSTFSIYKLARELKFHNPLFPVVLFALNPLIILESLISSHNDIVMMALALAGIYFLFKKQWPVSLVLIIFSAAVKFVTLVLLPVLIIALLFRLRKKTIPNYKLVLFSCCLLLVASCLFVYRNTLQPWYFFWFFPYAVLLNNKYLNLFLILSSLGLILNYAPFLFFGHWDAPVKEIIKYINLFFIGGGSLLSFVYFFKEKVKLLK